MPKAANLLGQTFGKWTVISKARRNSPTDRSIYWNCKCECGTIRKVPTTNLVQGRSRGCTKCYHKAASKLRRTSGTKTMSDGYVLIKDWNHPNRHANNYVREHVKVMSEFLGRPLFKGENIHHINGVRNDNRIENLELWITSQPSGQRPQDLVKWAKEILEKYDES